MTTLPIVFFCGAVGGLLFAWLRIPGGMMTGAMLAVVLYNSLTPLPKAETPAVLEGICYICLGVIVGNMYQPGMLAAVRDTWHVLVCSTGVVLLGGIVSAWFVYKSGLLSPAGAYLATTPGGLNALTGMASEMIGSEVPIVLIYHIVRIYVIVFTAPYIGKLLHFLAK